MRRMLAGLLSFLCLLGCSSEHEPTPVLGGGGAGNGGASMGGAAGGGTGGTGAGGAGASTEGIDGIGGGDAGAAGAAADAGDGSPNTEGSPDAASGTVEITLDPDTIEMFDLPIGSVRFAASGYDARARVCASVIWDYSNNDIEVGRYCGNFLVYDEDGYLARSGFPYVILLPDQDTHCGQLWDYGGPPDPIAATGCIDPIEDRVNANVEIEIAGIHYLIHATNDPTLE